MAQNVPPNVVKELAPSGKLRAAINFGNIVLAQKDPAGGEPRGVSAELARELAQAARRSDRIRHLRRRRQGVRRTQGRSLGRCLPGHRSRSLGDRIHRPYVVIEGAYLVPAISPLQTNEDVDRDGVRVAVARGSAYDLYLTRAFKRAQLVRESSGRRRSTCFEKIGSRRRPASNSRSSCSPKTNPDTRVIPGRFMVIEQAMGTPRGADASVRYLREFIEEMKASGFVAKALKASDQPDAAVAPPTPAK